MFIFSVVIVIGFIFVLTRRHYSKWKRLGIACDNQPSIVYGSLHKVGRQELPMGLALAEIYKKFHNKFVGIYLLFKPTILIRDAELTRQVMTSAFEHFHDRGIYVDEEYNPMSANLLSLKGQRWRSLRAKLTPSFSSGKLKAMFDTVDDVAQKLIGHMSQKLQEENGDGHHTFEMKSLLTTYAVDIVGSVIFGLDVDSFSNPDNEFRLLTNQVFQQSSILQKLLSIMSFACPPIAFILGRLGVRDPVTYRFRDIVQQTIEYREKNGVTRKDLLQLLIQLRNFGKLNEDGEKEEDDDAGENLWKMIHSREENSKSMSIDIIASNSFLFYMAGSETTASTTSYTIYELSMNPEVLKKAQDDVDKALRKHNLNFEGKLTYEAVQDMTYLDLCVMETLRKYPAAPFLNRECTMDYHIPASKFTITKGTGIVVSVFGLHRDPEYFPEPLEYIPERFSKDCGDYNPMAYLPFGQGPRQCIAQRMGVVNVKAALAKILANFNIQTVAHKEVEFKFHSAPVLVPKDPLNVSFSKRLLNSSQI
ncbi:cytochrome P450 6d3-like [Haematobia irritans]|uniref:cytochrome P450 6d3-like n=1 Tax=Haematobia irritans TaxID=7368 RepID=UPI003F5027F2